MASAVQTRERPMLPPRRRHATPTLDLSRTELMPLEYHHPNDIFRLIDPDEYDNNNALRTSVLKTRSIIAASFLNGDLVAKYEVLRKGDFEVPYLLVGTQASMQIAPSDFAAMLMRPSVNTHDLRVRALLPVTEDDSGWRTQYGWIAIRHPTLRDASALHGFFRPSIAWLTERPESLRSIEIARGIKRLDLVPLEVLFYEALPG